MCAYTDKGKNQLGIQSIINFLNKLNIRILSRCTYVLPLQLFEPNMQSQKREEMPPTDPCDLLLCLISRKIISVKNLLRQEIELVLRL